MENSGKNNTGQYYTIIGIAIGIVSLSVNIWQYVENKEMRKNQAELTALQLQEAKAKLAAKSQPNTTT